MLEEARFKESKLTKKHHELKVKWNNSKRLLSSTNKNVVDSQNALELLRGEAVGECLIDTSKLEDDVTKAEEEMDALRENEDEMRRQVKEMNALMKNLSDKSNKESERSKKNMTDMSNT